MSEQGLSARDEGARLLQAGDLEGAARSLQAAVQQNPSDARAYAFLGICRTRLGDPEGGIAALGQAAQLSPTDAVLRYNLGVALSQMGRVAEAKQALEQALQLNPAHAGAREQLVRLQSAPASAVAAPPAVAPPPAPAGPPPAPPQAGPVGIPPAGALPAWAPPAQVASDPTVANPAAWSPAPPPAALGGWNPTPQPPLGGGGYGAEPPAGGPPAWSPAPPAAGGAQHGEFTGSPAAMYYAQDQTFGGKHPGLGTRVMRGALWGLLHGHWWTLWATISGIIFGRAFRDMGAFALEMVIRGFVYSFFGMIVGLIIGACDLDEDKGQWVGVGAGMVLCVLYMLMTQNPLALINVFFYYVTGREVGRGLVKRIQAPVS